MRNFIQDGDRILVSQTSGTAKAAGLLFAVGGKVVCLVEALAATGSATAKTQGVFQVAKAAPLVITAGDRLYLKSDDTLTKTQADGPFAGYAHASALSADTVVNVMLVAPAPQAAVVAAVATADSDATYGAAESTLINELKTQVNAILTALKNAGLMASA